MVVPTSVPSSVCLRLLVAPQSQKYLAVSVFLILAALVGDKLRTSLWFEFAFSWWLTLSSSFECCLFKSFACFKIGMFVCSLLICRGSSVFWHRLLVRHMQEESFCRSVVGLFRLPSDVFGWAEVFNFDEVLLIFFFPYVFQVFCALSKNAWLTLFYRTPVPCFLLEALSTFWCMIHSGFRVRCAVRVRARFPLLRLSGCSDIVGKTFLYALNIVGPFVENPCLFQSISAYACWWTLSSASLARSPVRLPGPRRLPHRSFTGGLEPQ